jgi:RNA polymerase sigma-70 factor, ECF subfamily
MDAAHQIVAQIFRQKVGRILASSISSVGDFELAQDALQDALACWLESWPNAGIPP